MNQASKQVTEIKTFSEAMVHDSDFINSIKEIEYVMNQQACTPEALLIVGESGVGKTSIVEHVDKKYQVPESRELSPRPVAFIRQIETISIGSFQEALLAALHDLNPSKGTLTEKKLRIMRYKETLGLILVILDEFHDMLPKTIHERSVSVKFVKWLIVELKVSVVMVGLPACTEIINLSDQIGSRVRRVININHFSLASEAETFRFASFLKSLMKKHPKDIKDLLDESGDGLKRLLLASGGNKRIIKRLLKSAFDLNPQTKEVNFNLLHEAWIIESSKIETKNKKISPFKSSINLINKELLERGLM
jgi:Cdc6-like AAA superfamily ATPase